MGFCRLPHPALRREGALGRVYRTRTVALIAIVVEVVDGRVLKRFACFRRRSATSHIRTAVVTLAAVPTNRVVTRSLVAEGVYLLDAHARSVCSAPDSTPRAELGNRRAHHCASPPLLSARRIAANVRTPRTRLWTCFEMYETSFQDRTLEYDASAAGVAAGPIVGNGSLFVQMDGSKDEVSTPLRTWLGASNTLSFTAVHREYPGSMPPVSKRALHLSNGTYRSVAGSNGLDVEHIVDVSVVRQSPSSCLQSVWCRDASTLAHTVTPPTGMTISRADLVVRKVGGQVLPHLAIEGTIGAIKVAYCCVYACTDASYDGVHEPEPETSKVRSVIETRSPGCTLWMMHTILHGPFVSATYAFDACSKHFRANATPSASLENVRSLHTLRWASLWGGRITIDAAPGLSDEDAERIRVLNVHIQTSLYRLFIDMPDPNAISDVGFGSPSARPHAIMKHLALAPIAPWLAFMQPVVRPSTWTPLYEIAGQINDVWDGYRVTLDRTRLSLHFQSLRHHINELTVRVENSAPSSANGAAVTTGTVKTRAGEYVDDDPYTTGAAKRAFESAEQICNALRVPSDSIWGDFADELKVPRRDAFSTEIANTNPPSPTQDGLVLLHPAVLRPYGTETNLGPYSQLLDGNGDALFGAAQGAACPAAFASIAALAADIARLGTVSEMCDRMDACFSWLMDRCADVLDPSWGATSLSGTSDASDIIACLLYGFTRVKIRGYVTRDGIHTVPASLVSGASTAILPRSWRVVRRRISRSADRQTEHLTQNARDGA